MDTDNYCSFNYQNSMVGIFEAEYASDNRVNNFKIKFLNELFLKELNISDPAGDNVNKISDQLHNLLLSSFLKLNQGVKTTIDNIHIFNKFYTMQCSMYDEKFLFCTFYNGTDISVSFVLSSHFNIFESYMDILLVVGENGKILYGNKKAIETYGYTSDELIKMDIYELRKQDSMELTKSQLDKALDDGIVFKTFHYKKDGSQIPVEVRSVCTNKDSKTSVISIVRDMSEMDKIVSNSIMFSTSLDIFEDAILGLTKDFRVSLWSEGAEKKLGYKRDEIVGKSAKILVPANKISEYENQIRMLKNGNIIKNVETQRIHKSGKLIDISLSTSPLYDSDGAFNGAVGIYKDISETKELAKKLREFEERWRLALEGGQFGVWDMDLSSQMMIHFNNWGKTLGYNENEINGSYDIWRSLIHPDDLPEVDSKFYKHFEGEEYIAEYRIKCKNSEYKWVRTKGKISEWDYDGKPLRMVGTNEDITVKKRIEEALKMKYRQLKVLKQESENANKAKSLFLANMSHEIRTPLNGIVAAIQLLQSTKLDAEQCKCVKMLKESADILVAIINDILDISKIEAGKVELNNEPFNLREMVNSIYNNLLTAGNHKGLEIGFYFDPEISTEVIGDELKLKQILINLISNAVKFTDEGYVSFRINRITDDDNFEKIQFKVKDSGIGIEDSYREKIFENFTQGDLTSSKKYMGTGLGLAISKQLALLMNGNICFESEVGQGSTFFFTCELKKLKKTAEEERGKTKGNGIYGYDKTAKEKVILCVEDNLINQDVMEGIIKAKGYNYIAAYNGEEALDIIKKKKIDLILMDIQMPQLNGFETTKIIRSGHDRIMNIPIIAMTAYAMREDKEKCLQAGMDDYISKPIDIENFYNILELHLNK